MKRSRKFHQYWSSMTSNGIDLFVQIISEAFKFYLYRFLDVKDDGLWFVEVSRKTVVCKVVLSWNFYSSGNDFSVAQVCSSISRTVPNFSFPDYITCEGYFQSRGGLYFFNLGELYIFLKRLFSRSSIRRYTVFDEFSCSFTHHGVVIVSDCNLFGNSWVTLFRTLKYA